MMKALFELRVIIEDIYILQKILQVRPVFLKLDYQESKILPKVKVVQERLCRNDARTPKKRHPSTKQIFLTVKMCLMTSLSDFNLGCQST